MEAVHKTPFFSWCTGCLPEGCKQCVHGKKLVLFVTGLCAQKCWYCPISEQKFGHDVVFANEWQLTHPDNPKELLEEAKLTGATGAGITGGDPLVRTDRCAKYIRLLKKSFGKSFHVHLYTPLKLVTKERLKTLYDAGLDEIRFHPDLDDTTLWLRLNLARSFGWTVGLEIPAIPGYEQRTKDLITFARDKVSFINLNELERSDTKATHYALDKKGFVQKDAVSYGIRGSKECGMKLLTFAKSLGLSAHFCTAKLKDGVQMRQRLVRRSEHSALPFDEKTGEGTLLRGCVYVRGLEPGANTKERLAAVPVQERERLLRELQETLVGAGVPASQLVLDVSRARLVTSRVLVRKHAKMMRKHGIPTYVEEYPTSDALLVDVQFQ